jgi:hypothetical protein
MLDEYIIWKDQSMYEWIDIDIDIDGLIELYLDELILI